MGSSLFQSRVVGHGRLAVPVSRGRSWAAPAGGRVRSGRRGRGGLPGSFVLRVPPASERKRAAEQWPVLGPLRRVSTRAKRACASAGEAGGHQSHSLVSSRAARLCERSATSSVWEPRGQENRTHPGGPGARRPAPKALGQACARLPERFDVGDSSRIRLPHQWGGAVPHVRTSQHSRTRLPERLRRRAAAPEPPG